MEISAGSRVHPPTQRLGKEGRVGKQTKSERERDAQRAGGEVEGSSSVGGSSSVSGVARNVGEDRREFKTICWYVVYLLTSAKVQILTPEELCARDCKKGKFSQKHFSRTQCRQVH